MFAKKEAMFTRQMALFFAQPLMGALVIEPFSREGRKPL
jgi:hypothetical protein